MTTTTRLSASILGVVGALAACGDTTTLTPTQVNLDRPVDIAFACYGGLRLTGGTSPGTIDQDVVVSALPRAACEIRSGAEVDQEAPVPPGQEDLVAVGGSPVAPSSWYGLILQQGLGTIAVTRFTTKPSTAFSGSGGEVQIIDSDPFTPGTNGISVGEDPIAVATDASGCYAITANAGSCDLSVLDLTTALDDDPATRVSRLAVTNRAGTPLRAKPAAMAAQPQTAVIGNACSAESSGIVYIAYPSCQLVAGVDTATGQLVTGIQYDAAGTPLVLTDGQLDTLTCPDECVGGQAARPGPRPVTLDLQVDARTAARQMVIGADNVAGFVVVELDAESRPASLRQVALQNQDPTQLLGVRSITLSPTIGMGGRTGEIVDAGAAGGDFRFVYAVTTDGTVRVADILTLDQECDTQVDPRFLPSVRSVRELACLPVGAPTTPRRRAGARGPGIELIGDSVPLSVAISKAVEIDQDNRTAPAKLVGYFAYITSTSGVTFVVNVDDDNFDDLFEPGRPLIAPIPLAIAHQLRDTIPARERLSQATTGMPPVTSPDCLKNGEFDTAGTAIAGPRASTPPIRTVLAGAFAPEKVTQLPGIRQVLCESPTLTRAVSELQYAADEATRFQAFPDLRGLRGDENWSLTWEGPLSNDSVTSELVDGPAIRESLASIDGAGMHILDQTQPYCDAGVEPYDIVQFRGCEPSIGDVDCPIGYRCYTHPESQVPGLGACMLANEAERLADACKAFLTSIRRYTVATASTGELLLVPRRHELRTTPLDGCQSDDQCQDLADYLLTTVESAPPSSSTAGGSPFTWACVNDPTRSPIGDGTGRRCEMTCEALTDCAVGLVCDGGFCMEGVTPPQACVNAPQRYTLNAHEAFAVVGSRSGYVHPIIADAAGKCITDPNAHPLQRGRIPLIPRDLFDPSITLTCDPAADPLTGQRPDGTFDPNPCATTVNQVEPRPRYVEGTCNLADPPSEIVNREAAAVKFRNRGFTLNLTDPYYPGDQTCIADRQGVGGSPLDKVPVVFSGYSLGFRQVAGFSPLVLPITATFPVKVVRGPTESVWVIDEGDFLSTSTLQPSTRGKVFRLVAAVLSIVNTVE